MPSTHRITKRKEYLECYDDGRRLFSRNFVLFVKKREQCTLPWRVGTAVSKKTGSAVWRNRTKRLIKECFRLRQYEVPHGYDFVVVPKKNMNPRILYLEMLEQELLPLLSSLTKAW